jgi:ubiquinone/menaquinone biosynthesis C-methylase UbiE
MDINYWNNYYESRGVTSQPSSFAAFCLKEYIPKGARILELGSGNGRDAFYFANNGFEVYAIDQSHTACLSNQEQAKKDSINNVYFIESDFTKDSFTDLPIIDVFYSRFTMHSITLDQQNNLLQNIYAKIKKGGLVLVEARTINDPLCGVGTDLDQHQFVTDHYRRFIEPDLFINNCIKIGFKLEYKIESSGLSIVNDDDAMLLRVVLSID